MVVHHPACLHEGVHDGRAHEAKADTLEFLADAVRDRGTGRHLVAALPCVADRPVFDEVPQEGCQRHPPLPQFEAGARIADCRLDLQPVADNASVGHQTRDVIGSVARDSIRIEVGERPAVVLALGEDGVPGQAGLRAFQDEQFEQTAVVAQGHAPLGVVVGNVDAPAQRPRAAGEVVHAGL